jgi:hypothetical protein
MGDSEIDAMSAVATAIADLDEAARGRVLRWAADRYDVSLSVSGRRNGGSEGVADGQQAISDVEVAAESPIFEHFAEFFAAAGPTSEPDKALVAAYWVQVHLEHSQWSARLVSVELKHLGHSLSNVTRALSSNMSRKPQRVIQLKKSGSSKQATKIYKVTNEGIVYVQGMLSGGNG